MKKRYEKIEELRQLLVVNQINVEGHKVGPIEEMIWIRLCDSDIGGKSKAADITEATIDQLIEKILAITES